MKRMLLLICSLATLAVVLIPPDPAEGYWRYRREHRFQPRFSMSVAGGLTFYDGYFYDEYGVYRDTSFSHALAAVNGHFWVHPNVSLDLGLSAHFLTYFYEDAGWGYFSIKPGIRARVGLFYFRGALDIAFGDPGIREGGPFLFGFLFGAGIRFPVGPRLRFFGEIDYQYIFCDGAYMPIYFQLGMEFMF